MGNFFFTTQGSDTTGDGSQGNPWQNFKGKKNGSAQLVGADSCFFNRGDIWIGSSAELNVDSSGSGGALIVLAAYGTGNQYPIFAGAGITSNGWVATGVSSIYALTNQTQANLMAVTQDDDKGLNLWKSTTSTLQEGTFLRSGSTLYVHCWNDSSPAVSSIRIANFTAKGGINRGLVRSSNSGNNVGQYVMFQSLQVICANGVGMSASATSCQFVDCKVVGAGKDGVNLIGFISGNEDARGNRWTRGEVTYSPCSGDGNGQQITVGARGCWIVDANVHDGFMAGIDFLSYSATDTIVNQGGILRCTVGNNGRSLDPGVYDPQIYIDGADNIFVYGNTVFGSGQSNSNGNAREGIKFGSEHADIRPCHDIFIVNNLVYNCHWEGIHSGNVNVLSANIANITMVNNTVISDLGGTFDMCWEFEYYSPASGNWVSKNNIFIAGSNGTQRANMYITTDGYLLSDSNIFWQIGNGTNIFRQNASIEMTLAQWRTATGQDLASLNTSPLIVSAAETSPDVHLGANSPAIQLGVINPYTAPTWLPPDLFPYGGGVRGVARSDGTVDPGLTNLDAGFHYLSGNAPAATSSGIHTGISFTNLTLAVKLNTTITLLGG